MLLDEEKIEELFKKELKEQVEKKLKTFGRASILQVYADSVKDATMDFLKENQHQLEKDIREHIQFDTTVWKQDIVDSVSNKLLGSISEALSNNDSYDRY